MCSIIYHCTLHTLVMFRPPSCAYVHFSCVRCSSVLLMRSEYIFQFLTLCRCIGGSFALVPYWHNTFAFQSAGSNKCVPTGPGIMWWVYFPIPRSFALFRVSQLTYKLCRRVFSGTVPDSPCSVLSLLSKISAEFFSYDTR